MGNAEYMGQPLHGVFSGLAQTNSADVVCGLKWIMLPRSFMALSSTHAASCLAFSEVIMFYFQPICRYGTLTGHSGDKFNAACTFLFALQETSDGSRGGCLAFSEVIMLCVLLRFQDDQK